MAHGEPQTDELNTLRYLAQAVEAWLQHLEIQSDDPRDVQEREVLRSRIKGLVREARLDRAAAASGKPAPERFSLRR